MNELRTALETSLRELLKIDGEVPWLEDGALFEEAPGENLLLPIELNLPPLGAGPIDLEKLLALLKREDFKDGLRQGGLGELVSGIYLTRLAILLGDSLGESQLFLGLSWPEARWEFLESPHLELHAPGLVVGFGGSNFEGQVSGSVEIGELEFQVFVQFPVLIASAELAPQSSSLHTIKPLLEHFEIQSSASSILY